MKEISSKFYFLLFLSSLLNLSSSKVNAQTYYFMNDSATWKVNHFDAYGYGHDQYKYYLAGDTIINSTLYKKLRATTFDEPNYFYDGYNGAVRSDSALKKVYLVYPGQ